MMLLLLRSPNGMHTEVNCWCRCTWCRRDWTLFAFVLKVVVVVVMVAAVLVAAPLVSFLFSTSSSECCKLLLSYILVMVELCVCFCCCLCFSCAASNSSVLQLLTPLQVMPAARNSCCCCWCWSWWGVACTRVARCCVDINLQLFTLAYFSLPLLQPLVDAAKCPTLCCCCSCCCICKFMQFSLWAAHVIFVVHTADDRSRIHSSASCQDRSLAVAGCTPLQFANKWNFVTLSLPRFSLLSASFLSLILFSFIALLV